MDLSSGYDFPNPYGLRATDFDFDMDAYGIALRFLSDLAGGSLEQEALENNGASLAMLRAWESNPRFRRVLGKCRVSNAQEVAAARARQEAAGSEDTTVSTTVRFIPLEEMPVQRRSVFSSQPDRGSWGAVA